MHFETLAIHAGHAPDPTTGAVVPPLHLSTTFVRAEDGTYPGGYIYTRNGNPNRVQLEACLTALEGGVATATFASGNAATLSVFQSLAPGDHVLASHETYYGSIRVLNEIMGPWGVTYTLVDMTDLDAVRAAMRPKTRLLWVETPSNPQLTICDIAALAAIAHESGALCAVDNTWASPVCQRPLALGADFVMHSTTKYLGGHSDLLGGAVIAKNDDAHFAKIRAFQEVGGAVPAPFDCWLLLRGIRTLPYRVRAHSAHAAAVAAFLSGHPAIERVYYPGLPDHAGYELAARQMDLFGGMVSCQVRGDAAAARKVASKTQLFTQATSLGGIESLIEHRASVEGPNTRTPQNLLRLSVGLEHPEDLIADLRQALESA